MRNFRILGVMSGSSLDGIDLAICNFSLQESSEIQLNAWQFEQVETLPYPTHLKEKLQSLQVDNIAFLLQLDQILGIAYGGLIRAFLAGTKVDAIAIHGHTIIHKPEEGISFQLGSGAYIAAETMLPVISQIRDADISVGGQGAPLAPLADHFLFPGYNAYLNIGGISNCYLPERDLGFDTGAANQILNRLANKLGQAYDDRGQQAALGNILPDLFTALKLSDYFQKPPPKSLANQWVLDTIWKVIKQASGSIEDKLHTATQHIAWHITEALKGVSGTVLVTGGGAYNDFLIKLIQANLNAKLIVPEAQIIDYKEAALVAFIGLLRLHNLKAPIKIMTGAKRDAIPGALYLPPSKSIV